MTDVAVLTWRDGQLRSANGREATHAQDAKARRYVKDGKIRRAGTWQPPTDFGMPYAVHEQYVLDPIPGCRQQRHVKVVAWYGPDDQLRSIDYRCDCQRAGGTVAVVPTACSHAYAVHLHRTGVAKDGHQHRVGDDGAFVTVAGCGCVLASKPDGTIIGTVDQCQAHGGQLKPGDCRACKVGPTFGTASPGPGAT